MNKTKETPILLISGVAKASCSHGSDVGWSILYEDDNGEVATYLLWNSDGGLKRDIFKAINSGPSRIVWEQVEKKGLLGGHKGYTFEIKEVLIRRDIMSGGF